MELIQTQGGLYAEYEALLLERDQVEKEAGSFWTAYVKLFGEQMTKVYEEQLECIRCKKAITFCQQAINRGHAVDPEAMVEYLKREMAEYQAHLEKMRRDYEKCRRAGTSTEYEVQRAKTLYRRLAKMLHPDINPRTADSETLRALWERVTEAYRRNDIRGLTELEVLVRKALKDLGEEDIHVDIPAIEEKIETLREEIRAIRENEPYTLGKLLQSDEAIRQKQIALENELESYRQYRAELTHVLESLLNNGRDSTT